MSTNVQAPSERSLSRTMALSLGALGVVYGDIGTSPLYAIKECFHGMHAIAVTPANVLGVLSLIFWSLTMVITVKYVLFITRADNQGEGGNFSPCWSFAQGPFTESSQILAFLALFGAALLYGDGVITPAHFRATRRGRPQRGHGRGRTLVVPITCLILFGLFMVQRRGTAGIGRVFGPVMLLWFTVLAVSAYRAIVSAPEVLAAINPVPAVTFFMRNHLHGMVVLGAVVLCITGGEALYADMGHFGRRPIQYSWCAIVFPCLLLNYFGQGAGLLRDPTIAPNPFYSLVPSSLIYPMAALSTMATVIASQALISGVFSLTRQAIQLGCCPRLRIVHTSSDMEGQIYIPEVNYALMWACIGLTIAFKESSRLAAAYGIAVTATMGITSILYFCVARYTWRQSLARVLAPVTLFLLFDLAFFAANLLKVADGGWFTILIAVLVVTAMGTWQDGRAALREMSQAATVPLSSSWPRWPRKIPCASRQGRVHVPVAPGRARHLAPPLQAQQDLPPQRRHFERRLGRCALCGRSRPLDIQDYGHGLFRLIAHYGFMETPNVPQIMQRPGPKASPSIRRRTPPFSWAARACSPRQRQDGRFRKSLFAMMSRNARPATVTSACRRDGWWSWRAGGNSDPPSGPFAAIPLTRKASCRNPRRRGAAGGPGWRALPVATTRSA
jgi:KUP system potassium uptake protein